MKNHSSPIDRLEHRSPSLGQQKKAKVRFILIQMDAEQSLLIAL